MANKFKAEKHIRQRYSDRTKLWTFQVNIQYKNEYENWETYNESFSEKDYGSAKLAFTAAVDHRNEMLKQIATVGIKKKANSFRQSLRRFCNSFPPAKRNNKKT